MTIKGVCIASREQFAIGISYVKFECFHYNGDMVRAMASQITNLTIVYSTIYSGADQRKKKSRVTGLCGGNSPVIGEFPAQKASNA